LVLLLLQLLREHARKERTSHAHRSGNFLKQNLDLENGKQKEPLARDTKIVFVRADQLKLASFETRRIKEVYRTGIFKLLRDLDSIPRNRFRRPM
jgi:hypothetical protein